MKKLLIAFTVAIVFAACNNSAETDADVKNDSTILVAPESNSNMTDTHGTFTDSSKVDSNHVKPDAPATR